jgi:hypothetical protein
MKQPKDDAAARKARADRLLREIEQVVPTSPSASDSQPQAPRSPREFIHQRMAELDAEEKQKRVKKPRK